MCAITISAHLYVVPTCANTFSRKSNQKGVSVADYRLSAQLIKRSEGRSSVASSAYRAGVRMVDDRTGDIHNYERKGGVSHTEILAPSNTPESLLEREALWNAVETVERRKDAQLSREIQLSLPHELDYSQRLGLVRDFVSEQFVERGMIADLAIHEPNKAGDERNHHAHIMLTMREVSPEGFGKKVRAWNDREVIGVWREAWANHQNRALERHGHAERVDHRSYAERGIDQEPTQHRGNSATEMERKGKQTRIGEKNREIETRNVQQAKHRAYDAVLSAKIDHERASNDPHHKPAQVLTLDELRSRQEQDKVMLYAKIQKEQRPKLNQLNTQLSRITSRIEGAKGLRKAVRDILGITRHDKRLVNEISKGLEAVRLSEAIQLRTLEKHHTYERTNRVSPVATSKPSPVQKPKKQSGWDRHARPEFNKATNDNGQKRDGWNRFRNIGVTRGRKPS